MLTKVKSLLLLTANIIKYLILSVKKKRGAEVIEFTVVFQRKQHAHAEKVTVAAAYLIHIFQATVNYLK